MRLKSGQSEGGYAKPLTNPTPAYLLVRVAAAAAGNRLTGPLPYYRCGRFYSLSLRACLVATVPFRLATVSTVKRVFFPF